MLGRTYCWTKDCIMYTLLADDIDFGQAEGKIDQTNT